MTFLDALPALADLSAPFACPSPVDLDDGDLLAAQRSLAEIRRRVDAASAVIAGEIGLRSRPELGHGGLAQRLGARTPEILIQQQTGVSKQDARTLARVGALLAEPEPWLDPVAGAVGDGTSSVAAAEVIRAGLGEPDARVGADELGAAATQLLREAPALTLERLAARARQLRGELDLDGVADREALRAHVATCTSRPRRTG